MTTKLLVLASLLLLVLLTAFVVWIVKMRISNRLSHQEDSIPANEYYLNSIWQDMKWNGYSFPVIPIQLVRGPTAHTDFTDKKGGLILLFELNDCQPCLELLLEGLQHIQNNLKDSDQFPIYAIAQSDTNASDPVYQLSGYRRAFKLNYLIGIPTQNDLPFFERTPLLFLVNSNNTIVQAHHPVSRRNEQFSLLFLVELVSNYLPMLGLNMEGFENSPLRQIQNISLSDVINGRHSIDVHFETFMNKVE